MTTLEALLFFSVLSLAAPEGDEARRALARVGRGDAELRDWGKHAERKYVPDDIKPFAGALGVVYRLGYERRVTFTWRF